MAEREKNGWNMASDRPNESTGFERRKLPVSPVSSSIPTLKTTKTPPVSPARFSVERIFVFSCLVEELFLPQKVTAVFSQVQKTATSIIPRK